MEPINVIIILCTVINIAGCAYQYITLNKTRKEAEDIRKIQEDVVITATEALNLMEDITNIKPKVPHMPSQKEIDEVLNEKDEE